MNAIQQMKWVLEKDFPDATFKLHEPLVENGVWSLDVFRPADYYLAVAWQADKGFGLVSDEHHGYGEGAHEVFEYYSGAILRVHNLVARRMPTVSPLKSM